MTYILLGPTCTYELQTTDQLNRKLTNIFKSAELLIEITLKVFTQLQSIQDTSRSPIRNTQPRLFWHFLSFCLRLGRHQSHLVFLITNTKKCGRQVLPMPKKSNTVVMQSANHCFPLSAPILSRRRDVKAQRKCNLMMGGFRLLGSTRRHGHFLKIDMRHGA